MFSSDVSVNGIAINFPSCQTREIVHLASEFECSRVIGIEEASVTGTVDVIYSLRISIYVEEYFLAASIHFH